MTKNQNQLLMQHVWQVIFLSHTSSCLRVTNSIHLSRFVTTIPCLFGKQYLQYPRHTEQRHPNNDLGPFNNKTRNEPMNTVENQLSRQLLATIVNKEVTENLNVTCSK